MLMRKKLCCFLTPGSGIGKKNQDPSPESGMNNLDHISESLGAIFWIKILKFYDRDLGGKNFGPGINIPDSQHREKDTFFMEKYGKMLCFSSTYVSFQ
jgi:hypothetical protein